MESHFANLIRPYAGWAAVLLLVVAVYSGLIATKGTFPLLMFIAAGLLAGVRYWHTLKTFDIRAIQEWYRTRRDSIGVREWFSPYHAAALFCSPEIVKARDAAAAEMNSIMMELVRQPDRGPRTFGDFNRPADASRIGSNPTPNHSQYDAAHARFDRCNVALARELLAQLARGVLFAKGLVMQDDVVRFERIIPPSHWRVMTLDITKSTAHGGGWTYGGLVIGKRPVRKPAQPPKMPPPARPPTANYPPSANHKHRQQPL